MKRYQLCLFAFFLLSLAGVMIAFNIPFNENRFITFTVNPQKQSLKFYYKNKTQERYGSIDNLKTQLEKSGHKLIFAMNGGIYKTDSSPQGLYIENAVVISWIP